MPILICLAKDYELFKVEVTAVTCSLNVLFMHLIHGTTYLKSKVFKNYLNLRSCTKHIGAQDITSICDNLRLRLWASAEPTGRDKGFAKKDLGVFGTDLDAGCDGVHDLILTAFAFSFASVASNNSLCAVRRLLLALAAFPPTISRPQTCPFSCTKQRLLFATLSNSKCSHTRPSRFPQA